MLIRFIRFILSFELEAREWFYSGACLIYVLSIKSLSLLNRVLGGRQGEALES
jgi:hypothetical protein